MTPRGIDPHWPSLPLKGSLEGSSLALGGPLEDLWRTLLWKVRSEQVYKYQCESACATTQLCTPPH